MVAGKESIAKLEEFVKHYMSNYDCSHDWLHIQRVRELARELARCEGKRRGAELDMNLVDLAALLHDIGDVKYCKPGETAKVIIAQLLTEHGYQDDIVDRVCFIVENVSFRKELEHLENGRTSEWYLDYPEFCCVQDADRLDAIGAIGMARCLAFTGARNRPIYSPDLPPIKVMSAVQYNQQTAQMTGTALNHFYEKLLLLGTMMKTDRARELARGRTEFMQAFISQIKAECHIPW